jgi:hypothetical protein
MSDGSRTVTLADVIDSLRKDFVRWSKAATLLCSPHGVLSSEGFLKGIIRIVQCDALSNDAFHRAIHDLQCTTLPGVCCDTLAADSESQKAREAYSKGLYKSAVSKFSSALALLDETQLGVKATAAGLYRSRALCLLRLNRCREALDDVTVALRYDKNSETAVFRKAVALQRIGRSQEALEAARQALSMSMQRENKAGCRDAAALMRRLVSQIESIATDSRDIPGPPNQHTDMAGIADAALPKVEVVSLEMEGRAMVVADCDGVQAGQLILAEEPFATVILRKRRKHVCALVTCLPFQQDDFLLFMSQKPFPSMHTEYWLECECSCAMSASSSCPWMLAFPAKHAHLHATAVQHTATWTISISRAGRTVAVVCPGQSCCPSSCCWL